ncbi:type II toxin-antitoxin system toxin TsaT [Staphylococcus warneri]|uniref:type II toxin-antitoxin system toxin TsaT n=1 Tax=Staphylococcus warneri TaxID=1292 RepID=UPI00326067F7
MSLHFTILFWLSLIFIIAGAIILAIMLKTKKKSKKESYLGFTIVFFIFGLAMLIYTLIFGL